MNTTSSRWGRRWPAGSRDTFSFRLAARARRSHTFFQSARLAELHPTTSSSAIAKELFRKTSAELRGGLSNYLFEIALAEDLRGAPQRPVERTLSELVCWKTSAEFRGAIPKEFCWKCSSVGVFQKTCVRRALSKEFHGDFLKGLFRGSSADLRGGLPADVFQKKHVKDLSGGCLSEERLQSTPQQSFPVLDASKEIFRNTAGVQVPQKSPFEIAILQDLRGAPRSASRLP
eukprot:gene16827-biopygen7624